MMFKKVQHRAIIMGFTNKILYHNSLTDGDKYLRRRARR